MKRSLVIAVFVALACIAGPLAARADNIITESFPFRKFGKVTTYQTSHNPSSVAIFISGDGGWNKGVVEMAREIARLDALVLGVDITHYLKSVKAVNEKCSYPAADFEALSKYAQKRFNIAHYRRPVLIGYSSGATLVYALMVQAPPNTFAGGVSLGFCPDLDLPRPFCPGRGLTYTKGKKAITYIFDSSTKLENPWKVLQGNVDQVCSPPDTKSFVERTPHGRLFYLEKVGHGFGVTSRWLPSFLQAYKEIVTPETPAPPPPAALSDLSLIEIPASGHSTDIFSVIISGDGGWASIDKEIGQILAQHGVGVIGFNSLDYFWTPRTPEESAADLTRVLQHYFTSLAKEKVALIGYSLGADVLPFMVSGIPDELKRRIALVVLIAPSEAAQFEFHLTDWLGGGDDSDGKPLLPEIKKISSIPILCLAGEDDTDSLCRHLPKHLGESHILSGGHHFGGDYESLTARILEHLPSGITAAHPENSKARP